MDTHSKKKILVCGGRSFNDKEAFDSAMEHATQWFAKDYCIIHGCAPGADAMAHLWAWNRGVPILQVPANWPFYKKKAGSLRNRWMLDFAQPDLVIAFPGGVGTADMVRQSAARFISVWRV